MYILSAGTGRISLSQELAVALQNAKLPAGVRIRVVLLEMGEAEHGFLAAFAEWDVGRRSLE